MKSLIGANKCYYYQIHAVLIFVKNFLVTRNSDFLRNNMITALDSPPPEIILYRISLNNLKE